MIPKTLSVILIVAVSFAGNAEAATSRTVVAEPDSAEAAPLESSGSELEEVIREIEEARRFVDRSQFDLDALPLAELGASVARALIEHEAQHLLPTRAHQPDVDEAGIGHLDALDESADISELRCDLFRDGARRLSQTLREQQRRVAGEVAVLRAA